MIVLVRPRDEGCLSDLALDLLVAGGPSTPEASVHLSGCAACQARRAEIAAQRAAPLPPLTTPQVVPLRTGRRPKVALTLVAAAAATLLVLTRVEAPTEQTQTKGGPSLGFYVSHRGQVRRGANDEQVSPGDGLRFLYSSNQPNYLAVISWDAAGKASLYYPASGDTMAAVAAGHELALDSAVTLDETVGRERIFGFFCAHPHPIAPLLESVASPPPGCQRVELAIEKKP